MPGIQLEAPQLEQKQHEDNARNAARSIAIGTEAARRQYQLEGYGNNARITAGHITKDIKAIKDTAGRSQSRVGEGGG
ncbi:hypothetical protein MBM_03226 [Drepanopeziza brunnea f. sp. 'multigermtubi' MB_m1]|uniref:Uncharacterized protein n=1 Tax=Marssonina brunnea f. sp. multigermtubi (strain MB_m1) TaxID=1072389 RepID=K1XBX0_MARBU|nr:uncharacterized protein MBM_03226 [Drepanopeziza brunnea f. sp. 'multigermtubi' MB_m1]EKD18233.1 hypothetical protein MBM_03226 [Drepanopeziza brunnea f. sp. 'multigermtubi' MB_m1]